MNKVQNQTIVIDSNILLYCEARIFKDEVKKILRMLTNNQNRLVISELSAFETLRNCDSKYETYYLKLLDYIESIPVNRDILVNAVKISRASRKQTDRDHFADYIIGGTAIYCSNALLLTANVKDFPNSIWKVVKHSGVVYQEDKPIVRTNVINLYLVQADTDSINQPVNSK